MNQPDKPLPRGEARVLAHVRAHAGQTVNAVAAQLDLPSTSVGTYLCHLFKLNLVTKATDGADGRVVRYFPAPSANAEKKVVTPPTVPADTSVFEVLAGGIKTEEGYDALRDALKIAARLLDREVLKPENYDLVLTFHLGGVIQHLAKVLQRVSKKEGP
jgi:DNA-binding MarR family transcriptional regulator